MGSLLVPGTGAANLARSDGSRAAYVAEIAYARFRRWTDAVVAELSCEHPDDGVSPWEPSETTLSAEARSLTPNEVLYGTVYPAVRRRKYAPFPYDWRLDIRHNAGLLLDELRSRSSKTNLLTHSQGGLVALAASLMCRDAGEWHGLVDRMCLVAPPLIGTVNAMDAMLSGRNFGNVNSDFFRRASRTWPALFQMFPQWECVRGNPGKRSTSNSLWPGEPASFQALLRRAKEYFAWIDGNPFRNVEPQRIWIVLGKHPRSNTDEMVRASEGGPVVQADRVPGDTLVPFQRTSDYLGELGLDGQILEVLGRYQPNHFRILGDPTVYEMCDEALSS